MIPIRDDAPRSITPYVTYFLIVCNLLVFFFEVSLDAVTRSSFIYEFGVVPSNIIRILVESGITHTPAALTPILTSMFLHASWLHLIANMWGLWIFGDNIEDYLGHYRYLLLYLLCGLAASFLHIAISYRSQIPSVGASGAIAGIMGAYFLLFPSARVLTLIPIVFYFSFTWLPAWVVLGYWFVVQALSGAATAIVYSKQTSVGGVAFWAHVGGFLAGLTLIKLFPARISPYRIEDWR